MNKEKRNLIFLVTILTISIFTLFLSNLYKTDKYAHQNRYVLYLVSQIKYNFVVAHTWLEKTATKDADKLQQGNENINNIIELSDTFVNGGEILGATYTPSGDFSQFNSEIEQIKNKISKIKEMRVVQTEQNTELQQMFQESLADLNRIENKVILHYTKEYDAFIYKQIIAYLLVAALIVLIIIYSSRYHKNLLKGTKAIKENEKKFLNLFNNSLDSIILIKDRKIIDCNKAATIAFGYSIEELLEKDSLELLSEQQSDGSDREDKLEIVTEDMKTQGKGKYQLLFATKEDKHFFGETIITSTVDDDSLLQVIIRDISQEIENERILIHQSKKAAMGDMLGAISHQLKVPINTVSVISQELEEIDLQDPHAKEDITQAVKDINSGVLLMNETINDFRNFLKPTINETTFSVVSCVNKVGEFVSKSFMESGISLEIINHSHKDIILKGIPSELQQALLSILNNARDATKHRKSHIKVVTLEIKRKGQELLIIISDSAGGVPHSLRDEIFNPYFTTKGKDGTGIGLFIAKKIVTEKFGGTIAVDNNQLGAIFTITLNV